MTHGGGPPVARWHGSAAAFHAREVPALDGPQLWWFEVDRPALVLGSTQRPEVVRQEVADALGVEVVRRRSGGGAVLLDPGACTWVDVLLPRDDPRWTDDVDRSFDWLGAAWAAVLGRHGVEGAAVHRGPLVPGALGRLVCFAGLGPGEVTVGGRKVVGIAQRRTRHHARFQCAVLHRWEPERIWSLLVADPAEAGHQAVLAESVLAQAAVGLGELVAPAPSGEELVAALAAEVALDR